MTPPPVAPADLERALADSLPWPTPGRCEVPLDEAAGRVAAADLVADRDLPSTPVAAVDGYVPGSPSGTPLRVVAESVPGGPPPPPPGPGEALFAMTGGPLPSDCAGVVPREAAREAAGTVVLDGTAPVPPVATGARLRKGRHILRAGHPVTPAQAGRLADCGVWRVGVFTLPVVDLLAIGSEFSAGATGTHHDGNGAHLAALVKRAGAVPRRQPPAPDQVEAIAAALGRCTAPLTITTGGTAKGRFDLTRQGAEAAGFRWVVSGLALRPGQTARVAVNGARTLVSLPGTPGALAPLFTLLAWPILRHLSGETGPPPRGSARLGTDYEKPRGPLPLLAAARLTLREGALLAHPERAAEGAWVLLPAGDTPLPAGTVLDLLPAPGIGIGIGD
ncbi:MAG: hypothetical protein HZA24_07475 [Nitrospirae bacterium]|nr:hypothetical protein [Nitrospirota bacterium]